MFRSFFRDENEARNLLFALLVPDDDLHDVFVKFRPGIFARHLEFVGTSRFRIQDVYFLILLGSHQGLRFESDQGPACAPLLAMP